MNLRKQCLAGIGVLLSALLADTTGANAPGYTYELLYVDDQFRVGENLDIRFSAISESGDVVFATSQSFGFSGSTQRVYTLRPSGSPTLIFELPYNAPDSEPRLRNHSSVGIDDNGVVSVPIQRTVPGDSGFYIQLYTIDGDFIAEVPTHSSTGNTSAGSISDDLEIASQGRGDAQCGSSYLNVVSSFASRSTRLGGSSFNGAFCEPFSGSSAAGPAQINQSGEAAVKVVDSLGNTGLAWADPPGNAQQAFFGDWNQEGYSDTVRTPGFNDLGWMSFATHSTGFPETGPNPNRRVMLISPQGEIFNVAEANSSDFINFRQARQHMAAGVSLNNFNRVSFVGNIGNNEEYIWVGDASGDPPRLVFDDNIQFFNGQRFNNVGSYANDVTSHGANSMSDAGEVLLGAFGTYLDRDGTVLQTSASALMVAVPAIGLEPGRPILPDRVEADGGFRLRRNCPAWARRCFYDPPVAIGYDYTIDESDIGAFESVLIPAPLPGGDEDFIVTANGQSAAIRAGLAFEFATLSANPVRSFTISDISADEALDPTDQTTFVTGLAFIEGSDQDLEFVMMPITVDTSDSDGDSVGDSEDNCPLDANPDQSDRDGDGFGDVCDNCPDTANADQADTDGDGIGDACPAVTDSDGDGVVDLDDNCPAVANPDQADFDADGRGDACDDDIDGDGVGNTTDNCLVTPNPDQLDTDGDNVGDACEDDTDGDGVLDDGDFCPGTDDGPVDPATGCSIAQTCPCEGPRGAGEIDWKNQGQYVRCAAKTSESFLEMGLISEADKEAIVSAAGHSECGG